MVILPTILMGCMPNKFEQRIEETKKESIELAEKNEIENGKEITEDTPASEVELSDKQKEVLEKSPKISPEQAVQNNELDQKTEVLTKVPPAKDAYYTAEEASQYFSYLFYQFHTNQIKAEDFFDLLSPHLDPSFIDILPENRDYHIRTFEVLQEEFLKQLSSPIVSYKVTDIDTYERTQESTFYRMYEMKNKMKLFYMMVIKPNKEGQWLLMDDRPAPPYETHKANEKLIEEEKGDKK